MQTKRFSMAMTAVLAIFIVALITRAFAQEKVLHSFNNNGKDGYEPYAGLIFDAGSLYGTTESGGAYNYGTVFELSPKAGGGWTEKVLHNFNSNGTDGYYPWASLALDATGHLFGTTQGGGAYNYGTVFELSPKAGGGWTETVAYSFNDGSGMDGSQPYAGLIFDAAGNLYGTTYAGGQHGAVFELSPKAGGGWTEKVLYRFGVVPEAWGPMAGLVLDAAGNLYGTTLYGGGNTGCYQNAGFGCGTVFELTPAAGGSWTETVLYNFGSGTDGYYPEASLLVDSSGNLYGTTTGGGTYGNYGTVYELSPAAGGGWKEKILHSFGNGKDGNDPHAGLVLDSAGNLYGTTYGGGAYTYGGTVFELSPKAGGNWAEKILHNFGNGKDANGPYTGLIFDSAGNLYGTTTGGGAYGDGTVFELIRPPVAGDGKK